MSPDFQKMSTSTIYTLLAWVLLCLTCNVRAEDSGAKCVANNCLEKGQLELALGLGLGVRTNPLYHSDNTPLILVPDIAWYGEHWYLDNTELGYQWIQRENFAMETFVSLNSAYSDFRRGHFSNFILDGSSINGSFTDTSEPGLAPNEGEQETDRMEVSTGISPADISKRDLAVDGGIRLHWYQGDNEWSLSALHDVSNVYKGAQLGAQYKRFTKMGEWNLVSTFGVTWKSASLLDYYYGIDQQDIQDFKLHYTAGAGWFTRVSVSANRKITENWHWLLHLSYNHLPSAMTDSPLVDKNYTITTFAGVTYRF